MTAKRFTVIFETIPYRATEAKIWEALGCEVKDYYGPLDDISDLMVGGTDNVHISDVILSAEGINQYFSGHACDVTCLLPMGDLAEKLGGSVLATKARAAHKTIKAHPGWGPQEINNFIHDALLVLSDEENAKYAQETPEAHQAFEGAFAKWLMSSFPRLEVADVKAYLRMKWAQVRQSHPEIWRAQQIGRLGPRIDGTAAFELLIQCGFQGAFTIRTEKHAVAATAPFHFQWIETVEGPEVVIVHFGDAMSLLDVASWRELARTPANVSLDGDSKWLVSQNKQFMIDRDSLTISEPKFLRPLPKKLIYLQ